MAEKQSVSKKRSSVQKSMSKKALEKVKKDEPPTKRGGDNPLKSVVALGIVAILIGLSVGGYIALRYFEPSSAETSVDEVRVNELAEQLAQRMLEEEVALDPEEIRGYTQAVVPTPVSDGAGNEVVPDPTHMRYVNDYYGFTFEFPIIWAVDASVEISDVEARLVTITSNEIEMIIRVSKYDERSFKRAVQGWFTTEEEVSAAVETKRAEFAQLFPESVDTFPLSVEETDFGHEEQSVDGHDAFVDWYVAPALEGESVRVRRRFYIDNGRGTMFVTSMSFPVAVGADAVTNVASSNPFSDILDVVMNTWRFTNDGISDDADVPKDFI